MDNFGALLVFMFSFPTCLIGWLISEAQGKRGTRILFSLLAMFSVAGFLITDRNLKLSRIELQYIGEMRLVARYLEEGRVDIVRDALAPFVDGSVMPGATRESRHSKMISILGGGK